MVRERQQVSGLVLPHQFSPEGGETLRTPYTITNWNSADIAVIHRLERKAWPAPWLSKPIDKIAYIAGAFPQTNLIRKDLAGNGQGILSANRVDWDRRLESLGTWNDHNGGSVQYGNYESSHDSYGKTIVLISSSVDPDKRSQGIGSSLIIEMGSRAAAMGVENLIAPIRPSDYGKYKYEHYQQDMMPIHFDQYCLLLSEKDGKLKLHDSWLRKAKDLGLTLLKPEFKSMEIEVDLDTFYNYKKNYQPLGPWIPTYKQFTYGGIQQLWECGEAGYWIEGDYSAKYIEPNYWGAFSIPKLLKLAA